MRLDRGARRRPRRLARPRHGRGRLARGACRLSHVARGRAARGRCAARRRARSVADRDVPPLADAARLEGNPLDCLRAELERMDATLAVVGTRGHSRAVGIALGSVTTHLLHEAPCSVLVARAPREPDSWPRSIVVGVDGSPGSAAALAAATELAERRGATLRAVIATREPFVDLLAARATRSGSRGARGGRVAPAPRLVGGSRPRRGGDSRAARRPRARQHQRADRARGGLLGARRPHQRRLACRR